MNNKLDHLIPFKANNLAVITGGKEGDIHSWPTEASAQYPNGDNQDLTEHYGMQPYFSNPTTYYSNDGIGGGSTCPPPAGGMG